MLLIHIKRMKKKIHLKRHINIYKIWEESEAVNISEKMFKVLKKKSYNAMNY